ncbi:MAG: hypothetical protein GY940_04590, partial [bacterium]|nr:hypothetical protein [bacterium]
MTPKKRSIARLFSYGSIGVISILTLTVMVVIIFGKFLDFDNRVKQSREQFTKDRIELIKSKVDETVDSIDYDRSQTRTVLEESVREKVRGAHLIAQSIYDTNKGIKSSEEIKGIIKRTLRPIRFYKDRGYYFIDNIRGKVILQPILPKQEGGNGYDLQGIDGTFPVRKFIEMAETEGEGWVSYYWNKTDSLTGRQAEKVTFVKLFKPYDWIIGTGEFLEDVEKEIQEKAKKRIRALGAKKNKKNFLLLLKLEDTDEGDDAAVRVLVDSLRPGQEEEPRLFKNDGNSYLKQGMPTELRDKNEEGVMDDKFRLPGSKTDSLCTTYF